MARSVHGTFSPPLSSTGSYTNTAHSRLNIVSRLVVEGKVKKGSEGASIKLYFKITVHVDSVSPGQIIPLFSEENVKIHDYTVHPLDSDSVPYNFSSTTNPLLHSAARALNLPARSTKNYLSLFDNASVSGSTASVIPPLEERYTGYFLISGYNVCFVLPKDFPPKNNTRAGSTDSDGDGLVGRSMSRSAPHRSGRRSSAGGKTSIHFMAAIDVGVPFSSKPPKGPYLLSIPIPRCLSNTIKVRLPPPIPLATSFASLSSAEDDSAGWEVATEPHVTRAGSKLSRSCSTAYNDFADDESSEASASSPNAGSSTESYAVQGTFTSSDIIRIRWSPPLRTSEFPDLGDGRRRAGVAKVTGNMTCTILERYADSGGVKMRLDYQGTCAGLWFPGVATMLGIDVGLDAHGCRITWPGDADTKNNVLWVVDGDSALTGFTVGKPRDPLMRTVSLELPQMTIRSTASPEPMANISASSRSSSHSTTSSTSASLLRTPLPHQLAHEYSFDDSIAGTPLTSNLPSSVPSLTTSMAQSRSSMGYLLSPDRAESAGANTPSTPIILHLNMNDLPGTSSGKNRFMFNISGTVVVSRAPGIQDSMDSSNSDIISLPQFRVAAAESESISTIVRNQCDRANVEVLGVSTSSNSVQDTSKSIRTTVVPNGSQARCGSEGSEILVKPLERYTSPATKTEEETPLLWRSHRAIPSSASQPASPDSLSASENRSKLSAAAFRDGPLVIPWVTVEVVPLQSTSPDGWAYTVALSLPTPVDSSSEWLEFGLALPPDFSSAGRDSTWLDHTLSRNNIPQLEIACASVNGVPVRCETFGHFDPKSDVNDLVDIGARKNADSPQVEKNRRKWLAWVRVHIVLAGALEVVYIVKGQVASTHDRKGERIASTKDEYDVLVFMPEFSIPVGRLDATVRSSFDSSRDEEGRHSSPRKIYKVQVVPFTYSNFKMGYPSLVSKAKQSRFKRAARGMFSALIPLLPYLLVALLLNHVMRMRMELHTLRKEFLHPNDTEQGNVDSRLVHTGGIWDKTVTVTLNACQSSSTSNTASASSDRRWFADTFTVSYSAPTHSSKSVTIALETPPTVISKGEVVAEETPNMSDTIAEKFDAKPGDSSLSYFYLPLSWLHFHYQKMEYDNVKADVSWALRGVWRFLEYAFHYPLEPDAQGI